MATRQRFYQASDAESTTTSTTYQDKVVLTFTPDASSDYYILFCGRMQLSLNTFDAKCRLYHETAAAERVVINVEPEGVNEYMPVYGIYKYSSGASPAEQTFKVQFATEDASATVAYKDVRIIALKKAANDLDDNVPGELTTTSATAVDTGAEVAVPAGTWLLLWSAVGQSGSGNAVFSDLYDGTTAFDQNKEFVTDATSWEPQGGMVRVAPGSTTNYKVRYWARFTFNSVKTRTVQLVALDLSEFENEEYGEQRGATSTTSTTYQDRTSLTFTPPAVEHLVISSHGACGSSSGNPMAAQLLEGATSKGEARLGQNTNDDFTNVFQFYVATLAAASTTWKNQYRAVTTGTANSNDNAIAVLQIETDGDSFSGTSAVTLGTLTAAGSGAHGASGAAATTVGAPASAASGYALVSGSSVVTLGGVTGAAAAAHGVSGATATTLPSAIAASAGYAQATGTAEVALGPLSAAGDAAHGVSGAAATEGGAIASAGQGYGLVAGAAGTDLGSVASDGLGFSGQGGVSAVALAGMLAEGVAVHGVSGTAGSAVGSVMSGAEGAAGGGYSVVTLGIMSAGAVGWAIVLGAAATALPVLLTTTAGEAEGEEPVTLEIALRAFLLEDTDVSAFVGTRMYPLILPQNPIYPALTYQRISAVRLRSLDGPVGTAQPRIQVDCYAPEYADVKDLANAVRRRIDGYVGLMGTAQQVDVGATTVESERDLYEDEARVYRVSMDVFVQHGE